VGGHVPDASDDPMPQRSLPIAPPVSLASSAPPRPPQEWRSGWFVGGIAIAGTGQLLAGAPWLLASYTFVRNATPDSLFFVDCCTIALQLVLLAGCLGTGLGLLRRNRNRNRSLGLGLVVGWAGGLAALVIGTILIFATA
jgi:hypothetical protein